MIQVVLILSAHMNFTVPLIMSSHGLCTCCLKIMSQDELHVHVPIIKTSTDMIDRENLIRFLRLRNFRVQLKANRFRSLF